ncbi:MAG: hypothetical protein ABIQ41_02745 [Gemmatimonadales bacterium]
MVTSYSGPWPHGEGGAETAARLAVIILRGWGETWSDPIRADGLEGGFDFVATGPKGQLRLQVTRVPTSPEHGREVGRNGHITTEFRPAEHAQELVDAIRKKACRYGPKEKERLVLVLDGHRSFNYDHPATIAEFRSQSLEEARNSGFEDVLLVGNFRLINLCHPPEGEEWFKIGAA